MAAEYYYAKDQQKYGPITEADLRHLASVGQIVPTDLIWTHGMLNWEIAATLHGLFAAVSGPPPLPPTNAVSLLTQTETSEPHVTEQDLHEDEPSQPDCEEEDEDEDDGNQQVAAARFYIEHWPGGRGVEYGMDTLDDEEAADILSECTGPFRLDSVTHLSAYAASQICHCQHEYISLNSLETLSEDVAHHLGSFRGTLYLDGLETLEANVAQCLRPLHGERHLNGITNLSAEAARSLVGDLDAVDNGGVGRLSLDGVQDLPLAVAEALTGKNNPQSPVWWEFLSLNGLDTLSPEAARALVWNSEDQQGGCESLSLDGLRSMSNELAEAFSGYDGTLSLDGVRELSKQAAGSLAKHVGSLSLRGLLTLTDEAAEALAIHDGDVYLGDSTMLSVLSASLLKDVVKWPWITHRPIRCRRNRVRYEWEADSTDS